MKMTFVQPAEPGTRFAADAFTVGNQVPVNTPGGRKQGRIVAVSVTPSGESAELTVEIEGFQLPSPGPFNSTPR